VLSPVVFVAVVVSARNVLELVLKESLGLKLLDNEPSGELMEGVKLVFAVVDDSC